MEPFGTHQAGPSVVGSADLKARAYAGPLSKKGQLSHCIVVRFLLGNLVIGGICEVGTHVMHEPDRSLQRQFMFPVIPGLALFLAFSPTPLHGQCNPTEIAKLIASDAGSSALFGESIAISNDTMVIGAYQDVNGGVSTGSAYVFVRAGGTWVQQAKLLASDGADGDVFGLSVTVEGNTAVVGAFGDDHSGAFNKGSAYVFTRTGTTWTQTAKLTAADQTTAFACFGRSVILQGDTLLIGAFGDSFGAGNSAGSAFVFVRSGTTWTQQMKLTAADAAASDNFGLAVALSGDTALISAHRDNHQAQTDAGSAYVFVRSGNAWTQQAKLIANDAAMDDLFGANLALHGDVALIGSYNDSNQGGVSAGSAYLFRRSGSAWTQESKIVASDGAANDAFGIDVDVSGDFAIVGAYLDDNIGGIDAGSAYLFQHTGGGWAEIQKLTAADAAISDQFGWFVRLHDDTAMVSALYDDLDSVTDAGSTYIFELGCVGPCCPGDVDGNGVVDQADIGGFVASILQGGLCAGLPNCCPSDLNDDGLVTGADISGFVDNLASGGACE